MRAEGRLSFMHIEGESVAREPRVRNSIREEEKPYEFKRLLDVEDKSQ